MKSHQLSLTLVAALLATICLVVACRESKHRDSTPVTNVRTFAVTGEVREVQSTSLVVKHEAVPDFMPAMTMPFRLLATNDATTLHPGDGIRFRLTVSNDESWIDEIVKMRSAGPATNEPVLSTNHPRAAFTITNIPNFSFTNEHGQPVSLRDFPGQAIAFTFFFTRCPVPEYCPRLAKNFQAASQKLSAMPDAPTNWHLFSISFDPFDTPPVLRHYAKLYNYDSNHWSFLTGSSNELSQMARGFGVKVTPDGGTLAHGFATVVFDAQGRLQARWPVGGDTSGMLVEELLKGATNIAVHP